MLREKQKAFRDKNKQRNTEIQFFFRKFKTEKRKLASEVEDNVQQSDSRLHWDSTQTITGYKQKKGAYLQAQPLTANSTNISECFLHPLRPTRHLHSANTGS